MLKRLFLDHPHSVCESYVEHAGQAFTFGVAMIGAGLACLVHGLLPFLFMTTGSRRVAWLHDRMVANRMARARRAAPHA